jgi:hypothetical protein
LKPKTFHGSRADNVKGILSRGLEVNKSRGKGIGIYNSISVTDSPLLAKSMTKGELGLDEEGKVFIITKPFRVIDLRKNSGKQYWESLGKDPQKALKENIDGVAFENVEVIRIQAFYRDIPVSQIENSLEIQIFESIERKFIKATK